MKPIYLLARVTVSMLIVITMSRHIVAGDGPPVGNTETNVLKQARLVMSQIEKKEQDVARDEEAVFQVIDQAIAKMQTEPLQAQQETLDGFRQAVRLLTALVHDLLAKTDTVLTDTTELNRLNQDAVPAFRRASVLFQKYAQEESYADLKKDYLVLADAWIAIAELMEQRATHFVDENKKLAEAQPYIARTEVFLNRLQEHLDALPNIKALADRDRYIEQMKRYIRGFEHFRQLFHNFDAELRSRAMAASLRPTGSPSHPADIVSKDPRYVRQTNQIGSASKAKSVGPSVPLCAQAQMTNGIVLLRPAITSTAAASCIVGLVAIPLYCRRRAKRTAKTIRPAYKQMESSIPKTIAPLLDPPELPRKPSQPTPPPKPKGTFVFENTSFFTRCMIGECPDWPRTKP